MDPIPHPSSQVSNQSLFKILEFSNSVGSSKLVDRAPVLPPRVCKWSDRISRVFPCVSEEVTCGRFRDYNPVNRKFKEKDGIMERSTETHSPSPGHRSKRSFFPRILPYLSKKFNTFLSIQIRVRLSIKKIKLFNHKFFIYNN